MRYKSTSILVSLAFCIGIIFFISNKYALAQPPLKEQNRIKDFGSSLKKFERKGKDSSKDKETSQETPKQNEASEDEPIQVETNLIVNDVLVVNEKGNAILGLNQNDFIITKDEVEQKAELFSFGENSQLPRSIVLISLNIGNNILKPDWYKNSISGAKALIDKLAPQDKMAIVTSDMKLVLDFTQDKALLKKTLDKMVSSRGPKIGPFRDYGTLMAVLDEMFDEKDVRPMVIFQTFGSELDFLKGELQNLPKFDQDYRKNNAQRYEKVLGGERGYGFSDVLERVEKSRATIYSIIPEMQIVGLPREEQLRRSRIKIDEWMRLVFKEKDPNRISEAANRDEVHVVNRGLYLQTAMMQVAKLSGGYPEFLEKPEDAQRVYESIFQVINNRYTIGYYSTNQAKDGKRRFVKIKVRNHPKYTVVGKESYLSPK